MDLLQDYLKRGSRVDGWLRPYSAKFIAAIAATQHANGIYGSVAEIGVHLGRLFILLKLTTRPDEKSLALDVFGEQHLNTDLSGEGDLGKFKANVQRWTGNTDIEVIQNSSLQVTPSDILSAVGPCRLFSVDGGHTAECTQNDLRLAEAVLLPRGVAILDDYFNPLWPDVSAGAALYFLDRATTLRPFAITPNKVYVARADQHSFYRDALRASQAGNFDKSSVMFGSHVDVFGCQHDTIDLSQAVKNTITQSPIGPLSLRVKKLLRPKR